MGIWYCTRDDVANSPDKAYPPKDLAKIDRAIEAASRKVDGAGGAERIFYPQFGATRYFRWPAEQRSKTYRLRTKGVDILNLTTLTVAGTVIPSSDYFLEPANSGPPYTSIEIDTSSDTGSFSSGDTRQRSIELLADVGFTEETVAVGTITANLDTSETVVALDTAIDVSVGSLLVVGTEWMKVTGKAFADSAQNTTGALTNKNTDSSVGVADGTAFAAGEVIAIDSELMLVESIVGNNLLVDRAVRGTVLAAHLTAADIFRETSYTVERGILGSTAATHTSADVASVWVTPGDVRSLVTAMAITETQQLSAGYAKTVGTGEGQKEARSLGVKRLWDDVMTTYRDNQVLYSV